MLHSHVLMLGLALIWPMSLGAIGTKPNFVVIFADDMGYGDLQSYGHATQEKGPIDILADEGMRFTQWYAAESLCSPSRAALLTGRLPIRNGVYGPERVFWQFDSGGLPKSETTIAEALKLHGYSTGMVGKWHLGINEHVVNDGNHLPHHHGFDYVGTNLPFTFHWRCDPEKFEVDAMAEKCFLFKNTSFIEQPIQPGVLTKRIADDATEFIRDSRSSPFFLYLSMPQTHTAMICSEQFCNTSKRGIYGDQINEMAWAVGRVVQQLKDLHLEENTLVIFLSDHGPEIEMCFHGGSSGQLKGGKATSWEGGLRVPAIAWWPGTIPAGTVNSEIISTMDIFPTLLKLAGAAPRNESDVVLDGVPIDHVFLNDDRDTTSPHEALFHYCSDILMAVRLGRYKIHYRTQDFSLYQSSTLCRDGVPTHEELLNLACENGHAHDPPLLFDLDSDPGEQFPLEPERHSTTLEVARELVARHRETLVHVPSQLGRWNEALQPCCDPPLCKCNFVDPSAKTEL